MTFLSQMVGSISSFDLNNQKPELIMFVCSVFSAQFSTGETISV